MRSTELKITHRSQISDFYYEPKLKPDDNNCFSFNCALLMGLSATRCANGTQLQVS
jgi:hypothetical protein